MTKSKHTAPAGMIEGFMNDPAVQTDIRNIIFKQIDGNTFNSHDVIERLARKHEAKYIEWLDAARE
ncbi:MAG: hypothetical protein IJC16_04365 [Rikenellaceae bacterium]|nr:hypothetical protein [Rikenellaceae bacterium]